jgi:hypothetical protein
MIPKNVGALFVVCVPLIVVCSIWFLARNFRFNFASILLTVAMFSSALLSAYSFSGFLSWTTVATATGWRVEGKDIFPEPPASGEAERASLAELAQLTKYVAYLES